MPHNRDDIVKRINPSYNTVFDSRDPANWGQNSPTEKIDQNLKDKYSDLLKTLEKDSATSKSSMGVWRAAPSANAFGTQGQAAIESLQGLREGDNVMLWDMENTGTFGGTKSYHEKWYAPTEIGFVHSRVKDGKLQNLPNRNLSILLKPSEEANMQMNRIFQNMSHNNWFGLTEDQRRILSDLTMYAGDFDDLFETKYEKGRKVVSVKKQAQRNKPLKGSVLPTKENIQMMKHGLRNLMDGTNLDDAVHHLNSYMEGIHNIKFAGFNTYNYDMPMMHDLLRNQLQGTSKKAADKLHNTMLGPGAEHIDALHAYKHLYRDPHKRFGGSLRLEHLERRLGFNLGGQAHHALSDSFYTGEVINHLLDPKSPLGALEIPSKLKTGRADKRELEVGDYLFGRKGMGQGQAGELDGVFRMKDGKMTPAYDIKTAPLFKNTKYQVSQWLDGEEVAGKKRYGAMLHNVDDDLYHFVARDTKREFESLIHGHMDHISPGHPKLMGSQKAQNLDRATRRWNKMFDTKGGHHLSKRLYGALDTARETEEKLGRFANVKYYQDKGFSAEEAKKKVKRNRERISSVTSQRILKDPYATDGFVRDFTNMRGRLEAEEPWLREFVEHLDQTPLGSNDFETRQMKDLSMHKFGQRLDSAFGENISPRKLGGAGKGLEISIDGNVNFLNLNDTSSIKGGMYGALYKGHTGKPAKSVMAKRSRELVDELQSKGVLSSSEAKFYRSEVSRLRGTDSIDTILTDLSNKVQTKRELDNSFGLSTINAENPTKLEKPRGEAMRKAFDSGEMAHHMVATVDEVRLTNHSSHQLRGTPIDSFFDSHRTAVQNLLDTTIGDSTSVHKPKDPIARIEQVTKSFSQNGMDIKIIENTQSKGLMMAIANKEQAKSVFNLSTPELLAHNEVAVVNLPHLNEDGSISLGKTSKVARPKASRIGVNTYEWTTGFDDVLTSLQKSAPTMGRMMNEKETKGYKNAMLNVHRYVNKNVQKSLEKLSANNPYALGDEGGDFFQRKSKLSDWARGGATDLSDFAEEWYEEYFGRATTQQKKKHKLKSPQKIRDSLRPGDKFVQNLGQRGQSEFQLNIEDWVKDRKGIHVDSGSLKNTHVGQYMRSSRDIRELTPFGFYSGMARENILKSVNYLPLEEERVRGRLAGKHLSETRIDNLLNRRATTGRALEVMGDEIGYLNVRAAEMDDQMLANPERLEKAKQRIRSQYSGQQADEYLRWLDDPARLSTHDGMSIMADDVASAYQTTREKAISISQGAELDPTMRKALEQHADRFGQTFDLGQDITFEQPMSVFDNKTLKNEGAILKDGRVTVGSIMSDGVNEASDFYDNWQKDARVKGWNAESRRVVFEYSQQSDVMFKAISDAGHRTMVNSMPRPVVEALTGGNHDMIIAPTAISKRQFGQELAGQTNLMTDEATRQIQNRKGKFYELMRQQTSGDVTIEQGLNYLRDFMDEKSAIGVEKKHIQIKENRLIIDEFLGIESNTEYSDYSRQKFHMQLRDMFGTEFADSDIYTTQLGMGRQDVYDWEDSGRKVRYGLKEKDMLQQRARQFLDQEGYIGSDHISDFYERKIGGRGTAGRDEYNRITRGLMSSTNMASDQMLTTGDIVVKTRGKGIEQSPVGMNQGPHRLIGETKDGIHHTTMEAFDDLPGGTKKGQRLAKGDYGDTFLNFARIDGEFDSGVTMRDAVSQRDGTVVFETPDETFSKRYVRMVDLGDMQKRGIADTPMLRELEKDQMAIWRNTKEYMALGSVGGMDEQEAVAERNKLHAKIEGSIDSYEKKSAKMLSGSGKDTLANDMMGTRMDASGRYRIQGVNPFQTYMQDSAGKWVHSGSPYEEGTAYMSRGRFQELISGSEDDIARTVGLDVEGMNHNQKVQAIIDYSDEKGLYGVTSRAPTIKKSTLQATRVQVDPLLADSSTDRSMRFTVGTAVRMNADFDGDFASITMSHYRDDNSQNLHKSLQQMTEHEKRLSQQAGAEEVADLAQKADAKKMTVGTLQNQETLGDVKYSVRTGKLDRAETRAARMGERIIGIADNTRYKLMNVADATYSALESQPGLLSEADRSSVQAARQLIEDFGGTLAQDTISSKKIDSEQIMNRLFEHYPNMDTKQVESEALRLFNERDFMLEEMTSAILDPTKENRKKIIDYNKALNIFDESVLGEQLDEVQKIHKLNQSTGGFQNPALKLGVSEGQGPEILSQISKGQRGPLVGTSHMQELINAQTGETKQSLIAATENYADHIRSNYQAGNIDSAALLDTLPSATGTESPRHIMDGATVAESGGNRFREMMAKVSGGGGNNMNAFSGMKWGAGIFGGLWATSALMRSGSAPVPEGQQENVQMPDSPQMMDGPSARVTQQGAGENINISVSAKDAQGMNQNDIAAMVQQEMQAMTSMNMNVNMNVHDNTQNIDQKYLEDIVSSAINRGFIT